MQVSGVGFKVWGSPSQAVRHALRGSYVGNKANPGNVMANASQTIVISNSQKKKPCILL